MNQTNQPRPYQYHTNRQLDVDFNSIFLNISEKEDRPLIKEAWPILGEMAFRMHRIKDMLKTSEDYGMSSPETKSFVRQLLQDFRQYKLNGAGDQTW